jgi:tetratricopeptide (TPR) repeat protein
LEDGLAGEVSQFLRTQLGRDVRIRQLAEETRSTRARELVYRAQVIIDSVTRSSAEVLPRDSQSKQRASNTADSLLVIAGRLDRRWNLPMVLHGWVILRRCQWARTPEQETCYRAAVAAADAALRMHPGDPRALELRGTARWWSVSRRASDPSAHDTIVAAAIRDLQATVEADPSLARAWATLSHLLRTDGRLTDADYAARRALEEDEYLEEAPAILDRLYRSSRDLARFDSARVYCERGARQFPDDWHFVECQLTLMGFDGGGPPDLPRARALERELTQLDPPEASRADGRGYTPLYRTITVAKVAARAGRRDTAEALIRQVRNQAGKDPELRLDLAYDEACVRLLLGQRDSVFPLLSYFLRERPHDRGFVAQSPALRSLHGDLRFDTLVAPRRRGFTAGSPPAVR